MESPQIRSLMDNIMSNKYIDAKEQLDTILKGKVGEKLQELRVEVADKYYNFNESKLDPVGKEDDDVDNDGDSDSSDEYLKRRRNAISKALDKKKDDVNEESYPDLKDTNQRILALLGKHSNVKHDLNWEKSGSSFRLSIKPKGKGGFFGTYPGTPDRIYRDIQQDIESFKESADESISELFANRGMKYVKKIDNLIKQFNKIDLITSNVGSAVRIRDYVTIGPNSETGNYDSIHISEAEKYLTVMIDNAKMIKKSNRNSKRTFGESEEVARIDLEMEKLKKKKERAQERDDSQEGSKE